MRASLIFSTLAASVALATTAVPAAASPLVIDAGWAPFSFGDVGSSFDRSFEFTLTGPAQFRVTDAYLSGDQFEISINGVSQGLTSAPVLGSDVGSNFDAAFASPAYSHGVYDLSAGSYSVTGTVAASPFGSGGAAAELVSVAAGVPEPATWGLMILGFGVVGGALRRSHVRRTTVKFA